MHCYPLQDSLPSLVLSVLLLVFAGTGSSAVAHDSVSDSVRLAPRSSAFHPEAGRPFQRYVAPETYGATRQNWDAVQDSSGRLYVGNTAGVVFYDGRGWQTLPMGNGSPAVSLGATERGRVYVGAKGDFGRIRMDSTGHLKFVSLLRNLPKQHRSVGEIVQTEVVGNDVYFQSEQRLFRWTSATNTMQVWTISGTEFQHADVVRGTLYVNVSGKGLMTVRGDSLQLVPGGAQLADRSVRFLLPHGNDALLVGAFQGFLLRDGTKFRAFDTGADPILKDAWLYDGRRLQDGTIAIATIDRGLLLLAPDGTVRRHLQARGNPVTGLYEDQEGGLWALLDGGLLRYDFGAPFTEFGTETGLEGIILDITRHDDTLYAATTKATYRLQSSSDTLASFVRAPGFRRKTKDTPSWCFLTMGDALLAGTVHGLARRRSNGRVDYLFRDEQVFDLLRSRTDSTRIYAATGAGLRVFRRTAGEWTEERPLIALPNDPRVVAENDDGQLWVGTSPDGLYRIRGLGARDSVHIDRFGVSNGLPEGPIEPYRWQGEVIFGTQIGAFRYTPTTSSLFTRYAALASPPIGGTAGRLLVQTDRQGRTWGSTGVGPGRWRRTGDTWRWAPGRLHRLQGDRSRTIEIERGGRTVWFGTWEGRIVRHVPERAWPRSPMPSLIHHVYEYDTDSLLAAGPTAPRGRTRGGVRITYGTPSLVQPQDVEYQYRMEGTEAGWSEWTSRTEQTYRTLSPGSYTFAVRARLAYGDTTQAARYAFTILPPWYRTGWAYGLYFLAAVGIVAGVVQLRTRQLRQRQETLEIAVAERTEEIERQKEQLAEQAERLKELDEAKTRFFANVSHEFRTPITLILGPVQDLRSRICRSLSDEDVEQLNVIERNAQRLLRLVDRVLGIARMDAGSYRLDARPTSLPSAVPRIVRSFVPLAERNDLTLTVEEPSADAPDANPVYVDREALGHIVRNLLSNAIKFTPEGGTIRVAVTPRDETVEVAVADTGPGIPEDAQADVFDRFQQARSASGATTRPQEGAGIGLAFVRDLVDLHGGTIDLDSTAGEGTTVRVHLPRGRDHLADAHLAESVDAASEESPLPEMASAPPPLPASTSSNASGDTSRSVAEHTNGHSTDADSSSGPQTKRILVVEDNGDVRRYVRSILTPDFDVIDASNGKEGLEAARAQLPDVVLADVMMPEMDGHEMTRRLKDDPEMKAIPVIMVTARAGTGDEVEGLQAGADDYITKPFDPNVLLQRVGGVITFQKRLRERLRAELGAAEPDAGETSVDSEIERKARRAVQEHLTRPDFDAEALADELAMSRSALYRAFKKQTDTTPSALITDERMKQAASLLRDERGTVTQVAYAVGYERLSSFSRAFRSYAGQPPSAVTTTASAESG